MLQHVRTIIVQNILKRKSRVVSNVAGTLQRYQRFIHRNWVAITTTFLSISLCSFILYMLLSPLPELSVPKSDDEQPITSSITHARTIASLNVYLEPLKIRDLFKPSIPIPTERKLGKTTVEQLAERLQFLGTSGDEQNLSALVFIPERGPGLFQVGDRVAEFVLRKIRKNSLVLELENEQIILKR